MLKHILCTILLSILFVHKPFAQETMYVPDSSTIYFGNAQPAGIFGYMRNNGNIAMQKNAQVFFLGKIWMNESNAKITDASALQNSNEGGRVTFYQPNPLYANIGQQLLEAGYVDTMRKGSSFANITIDNNAGLLITSDMQVLNNLHFKRGHLTLNSKNLVLGDSAVPASITGFNENRFVITGINPIGGFVKYRYVPAGSAATFPVGPFAKNFAPAQIINRGNSDEFYGRAFEHVYTNATNGNLEIDSTLQITWTIGKKNSIAADVLVKLQHDRPYEDVIFNTHRTSSFITLNNNGAWDKPYFKPAIQTPGSITTSFAVNSAIINSRKLYLGNTPVYLSKKVTKAKRSFIIYNVFSPNGDNINDTWNIKGLNEYEQCRVEIFNRYGQKIFTSTGYQKPWDGMFNNKPMPVATYYYLIDLRDGSELLSGSVTLLR